VVTFRRSLVQHAKLASVDREVTSLWPAARTEPEDITHVILYGHTGSGKTSYGHALVTRHPRSVLADRDVIPVIWFRAPMPFTPREFCIQALSNGYNFPAPAHALLVHDDRRPVYYERHTEAALRRRLLEVARITGTVVWIVDEIQHLQYGRGSLLEHLEWLKNLADEAGVMLVLTGTYEAIALTTLNAQLIRRFRPILLDRYRTFRGKAPDADTRGFATLIQGLEDRLPLPQRSNLVAETPRIFRYTLGIVGLVKLLLTQSLEAALRHDRSIVPDDLDRYRLPDRQLHALARRIHLDESKDQSTTDDHFTAFAMAKPTQRVATAGNR
jgi:hypothetical protein